MHIVEIYPTEVKCLCSFQRSSSKSKGVKEIAYDHAKIHFPAQIRDMRKKPVKVVEIGEKPGVPKQGELFIRPD